MLTLVTRIRIQADALDRFAAALPALLEATRREPGCSSYTALRANDDPALLFLVEEFASQEALDAHMRSAHLQAFSADFGGAFAEPPATSFVTPVG